MIFKHEDFCKKLPIVKLEAIFSPYDEDKRKSVLIEGDHGSGKTTLCVYILQQWGRGKIFQQYKAIIFVPLHDHSTRESQHIWELLPSTPQITPQMAASFISEDSGQHVLFLLDGWNDLPDSMQKDSLFLRLLKGSVGVTNKSLHQSSIIVTSTPVSAYVLHPNVSSCVQIWGFARKELEFFFTECLKGSNNLLNAKALIEKIEEYPELASSCCLPLNASILVHTYKCSEGANLTRYNIFNEFILSYIYHHFLKRDRRLSNKTFDDLPEDVFDQFMVLCDIAHKTLVEGCFTFSLQNPGVDTLGLIQKHSMNNAVVYFKFIHQTFQHLMAAYFISKQSSEKQLHHFEKLLQESRFIPVLQFYAVITKLESVGLRDKIVKVFSRKDDEKPLLYALYCLCEIPQTLVFEAVKDKLKMTGLNLGSASSQSFLSPQDCQCIGVFLSYICCSEKECAKLNVSMINCFVNDSSCHSLVQGLRKSQNTEKRLQLVLNLDMNDIHEGGAKNLLDIIKNEYICQLHLSHNFGLSDEGALHIAEGMTYNNLEKIVLSACGLTYKSIEVIAIELKKNSSLLFLDLSLIKLMIKELNI